MFTSFASCGLWSTIKSCVGLGKNKPNDNNPEDSPETGKLSNKGTTNEDPEQISGN